MALLQLSAAQFLDRIAGPEPTPGGGSASALAGAMAAALVQMVCGMSKTRSGLPEERARLDATKAAAASAGAQLRKLVDDDAAAFDAVVAAYRQPKASEAEKAKRKTSVALAMKRATEVPLLTAEACLVVLQAAREAVDHGNPSALSDARTGAALAWAGLVGALENVRINAAPEGWGKSALLRADTLQSDAEQRIRGLKLLR